jgi:long-chain fatty acid transport protein
MKTTNHILATAIATLFIAPAAFATNGTNMIGVSAQAVAMGGTGTAAYFGAENVIINPAMIGKGTGTEFSFGGTLFKPSVSNDGGSRVQSNSDANTFVIPTVSLSSRINPNLTFGIGMYGTSGMGVDYRSTTNNGLMKAQTNLQIMRFVPTLAYNTEKMGIGFSPVIQYGSLDISYTPGANTIGSGVASDLGYGYTLGGFYDLSKQLTIAGSYTSAINMNYKGQLSTASNYFVTQGGLPTAFGDNLEQPAEIKVGAAYTMGNIMLTGDLKQVRWSEAKGYKDFGWQDQNVIALGAKYSGTGYWLGVGYNKADNPIKVNTTTTGTVGTPQYYQSGTINMFNNLMFPAITEQHFSFGGGYDLTKAVSLEGAVMYAPEVTAAVPVNDGFGAALNVTNTTKHSQMGYTLSAKYKF